MHDGQHIYVTCNSIASRFLTLAKNHLIVMSAHLLQLSKAQSESIAFLATDCDLFTCLVIYYQLTIATALKRLILVFAWVSYSCTRNIGYDGVHL